MITIAYKGRIPGNRGKPWRGGGPDHTRQAENPELVNAKSVCYHAKADRTQNMMVSHGQWGHDTHVSSRGWVNRIALLLSRMQRARGPSDLNDVWVPLRRAVANAVVSHP